MAIAIAASSIYELRLTFEDVGGEQVTKVVDLDGAMSDADLITLVGQYEATSNARIVNAKVSQVRSFTGLSTTATNAVQNKVSVEGFLGFTMDDPLNSTKSVTKYVSIPAYVGDLEGADGKPVTKATVDGGTASQDALNSMVLLLATNLVYIDKRPFPNTLNTGFAYSDAISGFGSVLREFDGRPGL